MRTLNELSKVLPDDTWLVQAEIKGDELTLDGRTASSATLVGLFEASPFFAEVRYLSPVTRQNAGGLERFNFAVAIAGR